MRTRISEELGADLYDIYGLTEIYGPGIGISCEYATGMHMWTDYFYYEIINSKTGESVNKGEVGEIVITTLKKQGAPLIRYRTHDLSRQIEGECACGLKYPRIDALIGRSDDMVKVKGVILFPGIVDEILRIVYGVSSEYQVMIDHMNGKDIVTVFFETAVADTKTLEKEVERVFKKQAGITISAKAVKIGELPRSEKKSTRIFDNRH
jgi:phenylacetate-CoA ligase